MNSLQRREIQFPRDAPPAADAPWNATAFPAPQYPQSAPPSSYPRPVPDQLRGHAGVVRDAMVSDGIVMSVLRSINDPYTRAAFSSLQRMLLVFSGQSRTGGIPRHPSNTMLPKVNYRACRMLTWAITTWPMITFHYTIIVTML
jgi:hypothetical protein